MSLPDAPNPWLDWSLVREPFAVTGSPEGLTLSSELRGSIHVTGGFHGSAGGFPGAPPPGFPEKPPPTFFGVPPGLLGPFGRSTFGDSEPRTKTQRKGEKGQLNERDGEQDQPHNTPGDSVEFSGQLTLTARPNLRPEWRLEPNLAVQVKIRKTQLTMAGTTLNISEQMKPLIERIIAEQVAAFQAHTAKSSMLEQAVREQWAELCRTIPLGSGTSGAPDLWLELRPTQALAGQPRIDQSALTLTIGVRAETRIVTAAAKPHCPFPAQLDIVPQLDQGQVDIDLPFDIPFTEVDRLIEIQLKGKTFPVDKTGAFTATVRSAKLAASADRLLISLGIRANETKTWLRLGADATIHVWGTPVLDRARQHLHFDRIELDIQSEAAFGALGFAAQAAAPYLKKTLADHAEIDLSPLVANARKNIETAIEHFRTNSCRHASRCGRR